MDLSNMIREPNKNKNRLNSKISNSINKIVNENVAYQNMENLLNEDLKKEQLKELSESVSMRKSRSRKNFFAEKTKYTNFLKKRLFSECLFDVFYGSLLLDESFKRQYRNEMYSLVENFVEDFENSGRFTKEYFKNEASTQIENIFIMCEETAKKEADLVFAAHNNSKGKDALDQAILNEKKPKEDSLEDENKELVEKGTERERNEIKEAVKRNVIETVKKEKEKAEKEAEINDEIKEEVKTEKEKDEESSSKEENKETKENVSETEDEESKETSEDNSDEDFEEPVVEDEESKEEDVKKSESRDFYFRRNRRKPKIMNESLFKTIQIAIAKKEAKNLSESGKDFALNMDMIFAESLLIYTLIETINTTGMLPLNISEGKKLAKEIILNY